MDFIKLEYFISDFIFSITGCYRVASEHLLLNIKIFSKNHINEKKYIAFFQELQIPLVLFS